MGFSHLFDHCSMCCVIQWIYTRKGEEQKQSLMMFYASFQSQGSVADPSLLGKGGEAKDGPSGTCEADSSWSSFSFFLTLPWAVRDLFQSIVGPYTTILGTNEQ
ncbi:uncharacterized protein [Elaeis guineensis]|uniref:uncharacterized protein n=1 Tax=Elaeis guineensis var. tenera TaxID=51953 RepID=UPI000579D461